MFSGVLGTAPALVFAVFPLFVSAGFFGTLGSFFLKADDLKTEEKLVNSQNMNLLQAATNPDPNPAKGGGDIAIVGGTSLLSEDGPSGTIANVEESAGSGTISIYVVRDGDSLSSIAKIFDVSVNTIVWANDIKRGVIKPGQTLVILPISGVRHTVLKGDTLGTIAKKYGADLTEISQFNGIFEGAALVIGDVIIIPDGVIVAPKQSATPVVLGTSGPVYEGYYLRPILGGRKTQGIHGYNGIDLGASYGMPVLAAAGGTVIVSRNYGYNGGYGNYIVVSHLNGTQTLYAHLSKNSIFVGAIVARGQVIGEVGSTGRSSGPHLHFEVRGAKNPF